MAFGLELINNTNRVILSSDFVQPYFFQKKTGSLAANVETRVDTGVPRGEPPPIIYLKCQVVSATPANSADLGPAVYHTFSNTSYANWQIYVSSHPLTGTTYEMYIFRRNAYSIGASNYGMALYDSTGKLTYSTADNKKPHVIRKIGAWSASNWTLDGTRNTSVQNQFSVAGISKPCVCVPPPIPRYYVPPAERRPELYRYSSFAINSSNNYLAVAMVSWTGGTGTFEVTSTKGNSLGRATSGQLLVIDGADYD